MGSTGRHGPVRVSVGVPVYNGERFLGAALESLLGQTLSDFELLISDNASTDGTEQLCRDYARMDSRVRYVRQPRNLGAAPNFNALFQMSRAPLFKWAASDDTCAPSYLERCVRVMDDEQDVAWCHSRSTHIDPYGNPLDDPSQCDVSYLSSPGGGSSRASADPCERFHAILLDSTGCLDSYGVIRADVIRKTALYLPHYGCEKVFVSELALNGRFAEIDETLFHARVHAGCSASLDKAADQQGFISTETSGMPSLTRLHLLAGYARAIARCSLSRPEKLRCLRVLLRYVFQVSKWGRVLEGSLFGRGVGGQDAERAITVEDGPCA